MIILVNRFDGYVVAMESVTIVGGTVDFCGISVTGTSDFFVGVLGKWNENRCIFA